MDSTRFRDQGEGLWQLCDRVHVTCPRCSAPGVVRCEAPYWKNEASFACSGCAYTVRGRETHWIGPAWGVASRRCGICGRHMREEFAQTGMAPRTVPMKCAGCGDPGSAEVSWNPLRFDGPYDPYFGFNLLLQTSACRKVLWAYNGRHLTFLRELVAADLRERLPDRNTSLASRLPAWIKRGAHRDEILRAIGKLEARVPG